MTREEISRRKQNAIDLQEYSIILLNEKDTIIEEKNNQIRALNNALDTQKKINSEYEKNLLLAKTILKTLGIKLNKITESENYYINATEYIWSSGNKDLFRAACKLLNLSLEEGTENKDAK